MTKFEGTTEDERLENAYNLGHKEGYVKALDDNNILHGEAAIKFVKEMAKEPDEKQKKFLEDCVKLLHETKFEVDENVNA